MDINTEIIPLSSLRRVAGQQAYNDAKETGDKQKEMDELKNACDSFEEIFVHKMIQVMRQSSEKSGLIDGGRGEEIFQDMLDENYAKMITKNNALGLSRMIFEHTKKFI